MQTLALKSPGRNARAARVRLCDLDELPVGLGRAFVVAGRTVAVFRTRDGNVFATANACPHKAGPLADGMLVGHQVVCPMHAFRFTADSGECDQPNVCAVTTYLVEVEGTAVFLTLPAA
ncbi:Rieske (2Fe-2S) protein [Urbifossiella limnaea]|uniref:Assimilatory nitrite reductase [NAD(P)H] small subunit n=1 Tax=Urbifossiella limnaea TaxID=2528023 RepID=A0A517XWY7_9BACT|nr:Rieske 2Fe-2S domain-containing protein [Urbifossiella limnaea]QDU22027.1 Assimilatory nitrite reductase [NAD(P)H] small subunit [Urbifossiella limnaea]